MDNDESKGGSSVPTNIEEAVVEFTKARQDRIAVRRARINQKITDIKNAEAQISGEVASTASSLEFLGGDDKSQTGESRPGTAAEKRRPMGRKHDHKVKEEVKKQNAAEQLDLQIEESRKQLEQVILDGEVLITNVRVAAEYREKVRQTKQEESHKDRLERLKKEAEESQAMYETLSNNWDMKAEKALPMDLYKQLKAQQNSCDELLGKKDDLITSLRREIEENDFEYEGNLEKYQKDSMLMGDRIDDLVDDLRTAFIEELSLIEDYTCRNREVILEDNQNEWMELLQDFENMEQKNLEERKSDAIGKFQMLRELFIMTKQEAHQLRHKMEDDMRILMQEREQIKYACHINLEKMAYNLHILQCRSKENVELKNMMKRLLLQLHDKFDSRAAVLKKNMEIGQRQTEKLYKDIERLESRVETFGTKTLHLALSNHRKFIDLWEANEELLREKITKFLDSDKFIFETQLGVEFPMPDLTVLDERPSIVNKSFRKRASHLNTSKNMKKLQESLQKQSSVFLDDEDILKADETESKVEEPIVACTVAANASLMIHPSNSLEFLPGPEPDPVIQRRLMKGIARVICDQSGFIVEEELQKILEPLIKTEQNLVNLDAVLQALGITDVDEMQNLARYMLRYCKVMRGVISRIGSDVSAGMTEMNISLEGIIGKAALEEYGSESSGDRSLNNVSSGTDTDSKECRRDPKTYCDCHAAKKAQMDEQLDEERKSRNKGSKFRRKHKHKDQQQQVENKHGDKKHHEAFSPYAHLEAPPNEKCIPMCCSPPETEAGSLNEALEDVETDGEMENALNAASNEEQEEELPPTDSQLERMGPDCSFVSNKTTVLSWLESVDREKMFAELRDKKLEIMGEEEPKEDPEVDETLSTKQLLALPAPEESAIIEVPVELPPSASEDEDYHSVSDTKTMSIISADSSSDASDEFLYIEPEEVITALKNFIEEYNNRQKVVLPTHEEIINSKLAKIKYPSYSDVAEYWEAAYKLLNFKGKDLWDTVQVCFQQYNNVLKERNDLVEDVQKYYQQNFELSHLLQRHLQAASTKFSSAPPPVGPFDPGNMGYC